MAEATIPGVLINEMAALPPFITSVETAIPAFVGYTQKAENRKPGDLLFKPLLIKSLPEYQQYFGLTIPETTIQVIIDATRPGQVDAKGKVVKPSKFLMYYSLQMFFANGGGACYIISVGSVKTRGGISLVSLTKGLNKIAKVTGVTLVVFPDSLNIASAGDYYMLHKKAMEQAAESKDRFVVMDVWVKPDDVTFDPIKTFRDFDFGESNIRKYAAIYYPGIFTTIQYHYDPEGSSVKIIGKGDRTLNGSLLQLKSKSPSHFVVATNAISGIHMPLPASCAIVGKYAEIDHSRGVWSPPANVGISLAVNPEINLSIREQEDLNVDPIGGKSVNVIRSLPGRGNAIIWGARTMAGNDTEWRYISVQRFFSMVEKSIESATAQVVFLPNDANTWQRIRSMIEDYLTQLWKAGALTGVKTQEAFYLKVGLNQTMTASDLLEGRMIVEIGLAALRPGEFILLRFLYMMIAPS